jgi:preprotein translocase subunit SecD
MIVFYRLPGFIAVIALACYSLFVLAIFKVWPVTLTLAGIAGYILSIGMAVDANILVFERTKEELRDGRPLLSAIEEGFRRAWLSIRDSNVSSLLTAFILMWFGSSLIKGFAVTLAIGILVSMFTALTVTRTLMRLIVSKWMERHLWLFDVSVPSTKEKTS